MNFDKDKFRALVLYVIWRAGQHDGFGATKLNKILWFADARAFEALGKPITGEVYRRDKFGPVPSHIRTACDELEQEGLIETWSEQIFDLPVKRFKAFQPADTSLFSGEELGLIDWWIRHVCEQHTAKSISELTHDYAWQIAAPGEEIPIHAFLASRIRQPRSDEEVKWAQEEASRLGLK